MGIAVYRIYCLCSHKFYIGSTCQWKRRRKTTHLRNLRNGTHHSIVLQNAWNKYGEENFVFFVEKDDYETRDDAYAAEDRWLETFYDKGMTYNSKRSANRPPDTTGMTYPSRTEEHCGKMSESTKKYAAEHPERAQATVERCQKPYKFVSPDGETYEGMNLSAFAREHNLNQGHLCEVLNGKRGSHKGWTVDGRKPRKYVRKAG